MTPILTPAARQGQKNLPVFAQEDATSSLPSMRYNGQAKDSLAPVCRVGHLPNKKLIGLQIAVYLAFHAYISRPAPWELDRRAPSWPRPATWKLAVPIEPGMIPGSSSRAEMAPLRCTQKSSPKCISLAYMVMVAMNN
jgi:hypothetical protein